MNIGPTFERQDTASKSEAFGSGEMKAEVKQRPILSRLDGGCCLTIGHVPWCISLTVAHSVPSSLAFNVLVAIWCAD